MISPNFPALAEVGVHVRFRRDLLLRPGGEARLYEELDTNVTIVHLTPGLTPEALRHQLSQPGLRAAILRTYGSGNAPRNPEFLAALAVTLFTLLFSIFVNAPLLELADFNKTPNPSKAPWYFLGLQELLTMFHPMVAGVTIPGIGLFVLILAPYIDKNPSKRPEDRKFAISLMTVHLMFWAVLVMIGSFFRGPGFNFIFPWNSGLFFEL